MQPQLSLVFTCTCDHCRQSWQLQHLPPMLFACCPHCGVQNELGPLVYPMAEGATSDRLREVSKAVSASVVNLLLKEAAADPISPPKYLV